MDISIEIEFRTTSTSSAPGAATTISNPIDAQLDKQP